MCRALTRLAGAESPTWNSVNRVVVASSSGRGGQCLTRRPAGSNRTSPPSLVAIQYVPSEASTIALTERCERTSGPKETNRPPS